MKSMGRCLVAAMRVKPLTLHCLPYVLVIAGSISADQIMPDRAANYRSDVSSNAAAFAGQIVNRSGKSDRRPVNRAKSDTNDKAPIRMPEHCKPPIDVLGRCFAALKASQSAV
jgi:hypothetical protein